MLNFIQPSEKHGIKEIEACMAWHYASYARSFKHSTFQSNKPLFFRVIAMLEINSETSSLTPEGGFVTSLDLFRVACRAIVACIQYLEKYIE